MANPSCIVEGGKLSPVGQRNLALFRAQSERRMLVVVMSEAHVKAGYFNPTPPAPGSSAFGTAAPVSSVGSVGSGGSAWMQPFREVGIIVNASGKGLRSDTKAVIVLTPAEWATRRNVGRFKDEVFQVWGDGGDANTWPVMPA